MSEINEINMDYPRMYNNAKALNRVLQDQNRELQQKMEKDLREYAQDRLQLQEKVNFFEELEKKRLKQLEQFKEYVNKLEKKIRLMEEKEKRLEKELAESKKQNKLLLDFISPDKDIETIKMENEKSKDLKNEGYTKEKINKLDKNTTDNLKSKAKINKLDKHTVDKRKSILFAKNNIKNKTKNQYANKRKDIKSRYNQILAEAIMSKKNGKNLNTIKKKKEIYFNK